MITISQHSRRFPQWTGHPTWNCLQFAVSFHRRKTDHWSENRFNRPKTRRPDQSCKKENIRKL